MELQKIAVVAALAVAGSALPAPAQEYGAGADDVPITASGEALSLYLEGRDLAERLRATDARRYYEQAVQADESFALGYWALANTAPTNKDFFQALERAVALVDHASEGERHMILALDAAVKGEPRAQREHLEKLVTAFPNDERAHNLLGGFHFGRQEFEQAIAHYTHATELNPDYSPPYNTLGYAHRSLGHYEAAEKAFQKYIQLIPDDPNPYDSYAELLMKMGRFEESIANYEKALSKDPNFVFSYVGIGNNQIFMGEPAKARDTFHRLQKKARTDGERRQALLWTAASYVHEGNTEKALETLRARSAISEAAGDLSALSGDANLMGNILLQSGKADAALREYERSLELIRKADVPEEVKENGARNHLYNRARALLASGDVKGAKKAAESYAAQVQARSIPFEVRQQHEIMGLIALQEKDFQGAAAHLEQANQQNPRVMYHTATAYHGAGDHGKARTLIEKAANFNGLSFDYAYVRSDARRMLKEM